MRKIVNSIRLLSTKIRKLSKNLKRTSLKKHNTGKLILMTIWKARLQNSQKFTSQVNHSKMVRVKIKSQRKTYRKLKNLQEKARKKAKVKIKKLRKRKLKRKNLKLFRSLNLVYLPRSRTKLIKIRRKNLLQKKIQRKKRKMTQFKQKKKLKRNLLLKS